MKQLASSCCVSVSTMQRQVEFYVRALSHLDECRATGGSGSSSGRGRGRPRLQAKPAPRTSTSTNSRAHSAHEQRAAPLASARARAHVERATQQDHKTTGESSPASSATTHEHLHAVASAGTSSSGGALSAMEAEPASLAERVSKAARLGSDATAVTGTPDSACPFCQVLRLTDPQLELDDYRRWRAAFVSKRI